MSSKILSFLSELNEADAKNLLTQIQKKNIKLKFKAESSERIETAQITSFSQPNKYVLSLRSDFSVPVEPVTFKIQMGTDIFFFKTNIIAEKNNRYILSPFLLFRLIRRKSSRYFVPEHWPQSGSVAAAGKFFFTSRVRIIELSSTGIKVHVIPELPRYEKSQRVKLTFKIHRRSEIHIEGFIRHIKKHKQSGQILGIEFIFENKLIQNKVQNVCGDLVHALA